MRHARLVIILCLSLAACKGGEDKLSAPAKDTPVFIISIDTLRSDHLPVYGYKGVETPQIDAFRADAVLYERAYSHTPLTLPSHASLLTGVLPAAHGVRDNTGYQLAKNVSTVGEVLRGRGYTTGAAVSTFVLRKQTGIDRGFDFFDDSVVPLNPTARTISTMQRDGEETLRIASEWIGKQTKPVFFLFHLYEPHMPYTAPEPHRSRYSNGYDAEIARADEIVGRFLDLLKQRGLYERSLVILLSDHGEGLGDHGEDEHGTFLYREAIQVPLLVKYPDSKFSGHTIAAPVQLIDVVPTIFERVGATPPASLPGRSLATFLVDDKSEWRKVYSETWYPRFHYGWSDQHSLIDGKHHYIHSTRAELFDLQKDAGEKNNILEQDRRTYFAMKKAIEPLIQEAAAPAPADREEAAKLAALGYLGSTVQTKPGEVLPDPKDNLGVIADTSEAFALFQKRRYAEVLPIVERLLAANPLILDLWDLKSKTLARRGQLAEAIQASKEGLKLSPNASYLAADVATMQVELGNFDDAEAHAELVLAADPSKAHDLLARIAIGRKDYVRAEAEARKAMDLAKEKIAPLMTMAMIQREKGNVDEALRLLNQAVSKKKEREQIESLFFLRGDVLARLGRVEEAERDFRQEIDLFPGDQPAYRNLTLLLVASGRIPEATALIRKLIAEAPVPASYHTVCQVLDTVGDARGVRYWARQGLARFPNDATLRRLAS
jgi:arylsulfatase A-like enzyme/Flp pilus assembly protein TadD